MRFDKKNASGRKLAIYVWDGVIEALSGLFWWGGRHSTKVTKETLYAYSWSLSVLNMLNATSDLLALICDG